MIDKNLCILPWVSLYVRTDGNIYPCESVAWGNDLYLLGNLEDTDLEIAFNHVVMKNLRRKILSSGSCELSNFQKNSCMYLIKHELYSEVYDTMFSETKEDGSFNFNLKALFLEISNLCNLKCIYCGELSSSIWEKFKNKNVKKINENLIYDKIYPHLKSLKEIFLSGGEPILSTHNKSILEYLKINNPNIEIGIATNLTYSFEKYKSIFNLLNTFNNSKIFCSIDIDNEQFEYIRENSDWNLVNNNLRQLKTYTDLKIYLNCVISVLNSFDILDFHIRMLNDNLIDIDSIRYVALESPEHLSIQNINLNKKKELELYFLKYYNFLKENDVNIPHYINNKTSAEAVLNLIEFMYKKNSNENYMEILLENVSKDIISKHFYKCI